MGTFTNTAVVRLLERIAGFLRENKFDDFKSADDFAERLFGELADALALHWASPRAVKAVQRVTDTVYRFYRLKDVTPFGNKSPVRLRFGGADTRSVEFFNQLDHFYFSKFSDNRSVELKNFLRKSYLENGSKIFGDRTPEELQDFRNAAGAKLQNLNDRAVESIIHTSVQRIRTWAHVGSMAQGNIKLARIAAILDSRTSDICRRLDGKLVRIGVAQKAIERLNQLEPGEFAKEMYESAIGKAISREPVATIEKFLESDGKTIADDLVTTGRGVPPYHPRCRSRLEAIIGGTKS